MSALQFLIRLGILQRSRGGLISAPWILEDGIWNDEGRWDDAALWIDFHRSIGSLAAALAARRSVEGALSAALQNPEVQAALGGTGAAALLARGALSGNAAAALLAAGATTGTLSATIEAQAAPTYTANPVHSDGTNDFMLRGAALTGATNSPSVTGSVWLRRTGGFGNLHRVIASNAANFVLEWMFENTLHFRGHDGTSTSLDIVAPPFTDTAWRHFMWSANAANAHLYVNDVSNMTVAAPHTGNNFAFAAQTNWSILAGLTGTNKLQGDIADLQIWFGQYRDLSVAANRRLFITSDGKPVDPATAEASLGAPIVRLSGPTASWHANDGTGGGFTLTGSLTDGTGPVGV